VHVRHAVGLVGHADAGRDDARQAEARQLDRLLDEVRQAPRQRVARPFVCISSPSSIIIIAKIVITATATTGNHTPALAHI
jgi:hypothetical protein